ncbi:ankyrin repeat domain-containing protein [Pasteurellaceae bacterium USgator11]|nr:ankyrin repeat domain-containing protein [Pasteurellaceae bacterium USgator41]TNG97610.1 ankyrin repeat domain-containing protein [Pasteurellaceae bacterium UScroc31]TNG98947.1 ankyrin repeat domain-containing protein [Pasteurellaceae bacterium USgator11]
MIDFYEKYKDDPGMLATRANSEGDLNLLNEIFFKEKKLDILEKTSKEKWNWLHQALLLCKSDFPNRDVVQFYIDNGVPINSQDMYGMTPLHYAMRGKNAEAALALLEAGADPNIPNRDNLRPLSMIGYIHDRLDVLELMLKKGGNVHNLVNEGETILESKKPIDNKYPWKFPIYELMKKYS